MTDVLPMLPGFVEHDPPLSPIGLQLRRYRTHRDSAFAIAKALRSAAETATEDERARLETAAERIRACARACHVRSVTPDHAETRLVIHHPCDCKSPLCPLSNRFKSMRQRRQIREIVRIAREQHPTAPLVFLTLTAKNRPWAELAAMLDDLADAEHRFWRLAPVKRAFIGAITSYEVVCRGTADQPAAGAHCHVLPACHPEYFNRASDRYLSQNQLSLLFQQALRADYKPIVHVARVRAANGSVGNESIPGAIRELVKYCVKPAELFTRNTEGLAADPTVIAVLARALYRRKMLRMTGIFATASRIRTQRKEVSRPKTS